MKANALSFILALLSLTFASLYIVERQRRQEAEVRFARSLDAARSTSSVLRMPSQSRAPVAEVEKKVPDTEGGVEETPTVAERSGSMFRANPMQGLDKMMANPVMKEMVRTQQRGMIDMLYGDLIAHFALSEEEASHFTELLLDHQLAGMEQGAKMATASVAEREALSESIKSGKEMAEEQIKTFLNSEQDYAAYQAYTERLPERQQLMGLNGLLDAKQIPLTEDQEVELIEVMHEARKAFDFENDFSDQDEVDFASLTEEKVANYLVEFDSLNASIAERADKILSEEQMVVFLENQQQMKAMQEMGLKMTVQMFGQETP